MLGRAFFFMIAGGIGGIAAYAITEPFAPSTMADVAWVRFNNLFGPIVGLCIGVFLGLASGWSQGSKSHMLKGMAVGGFIGAIAGPIGLSIGDMVFRAISQPAAGVAGVSAVTELVGRAAGWSIFGGVIGLAEGAIGMSWKRARQGMIGGLLGGALGGVGFQMASLLTGKLITSVRGGDEVGGIARGVGVVLTGACIGLLIGIVEWLARKAWVRLTLGRNEFKEWALEAPVNQIGRSELAHIPLLSDPNISPLHASIVNQGGQFSLHDAGTPIGIGLNGMRVMGAAPLKHGDVIQISGIQLTFMMKAGAIPVGLAPTPQVQPMATAPMGMAVPTVPASVVSAATTSFPAAAPVGRALAISATTGPLAGQRFDIVSATEIGRDRPLIPLQFDTNVSRLHAVIKPEAMGWVIEDAGSKNGTIVNGSRTARSLIKQGDQVQIGATTFRIEAAT